MTTPETASPHQTGASTGAAAYLLLRAFCDELARCGLRHACTSPGSRSTPLVLSLVREPRIRCWSHVDERCAAFFALGAAKASGVPVALTCTSGTAAANFAPPVIEQPLPDDHTGRQDGRPYVELDRPRPAVGGPGRHPFGRVLIVAGRDERDPQTAVRLDQFASHARIPLLADPLSGARRGPA